MKKVTGTGTLENGILKITNRKLFDEMLKGLSNGKVTIVVARTYKKRSNPQNAFYNGVIIPLCTKGLIDLGHRVNEDDTHEILKALFNKTEFVDQKTGEVTYYGGSTTNLTTTDMMGYFEEINQWAAEYLGVTIPEPDANWREKKKCP